jgi:hypothetical protein
MAPRIPKLDWKELFAAILLIGAMAVVWGGAVWALLSVWLR